MFYARFVLAKKGPLAKIWLAAHLEDKLKRKMIAETDIEQCVKEVVKPVVKLSLRTSGVLLCGICRIFHRKVMYLLVDAYVARDNFRNVIIKRIQAPPKKRAPQMAQILEEEDKENEEPIVLDGEIPNMADFAEPSEPAVNTRAKRSEITLQEDNVNRPASIQGDDPYDLIDYKAADFDEDFERTKERIESFREMSANREIYKEQQRREQGDESSFLHNLDEHLDYTHRMDYNLVESARNATPQLQISHDEINMIVPDVEMNESVREASPQYHLSHDSLNFPRPASEKSFAGDATLNFMENADVLDDLFEQNDFLVPDHDQVEQMEIDIVPEEDRSISPNIPTQRIFLDELTDSQIQDARPVRPLRKRRRIEGLIIDEETEVDSDTFKQWQRCYDDIQHDLEIAPPTKKFFNAKFKGTFDAIWSRPGTDLNCNEDLFECYGHDLEINLRTTPFPEDRSEEQNREVQEEQQGDDLSQHSSILQNLDEHNSVLDNFDEPLDYSNQVDYNHVESARHATPQLQISLEETNMVVPDTDMMESAREPTPLRDLTNNSFNFPRPVSEKSFANHATLNSRERAEVSDDLFNKRQREERAENLTIKENVRQLGHDIEKKWEENVIQGKDRKIEFSALIPAQASKKDKAQKFYALLELRRNQPLIIKQQTPFGPISIQPPRDY